jgi:nucleoside-diphosphate-sugar epimerase
MKVLITGGCGFIGSNLAIFLKKKNLKFCQYSSVLIKINFNNLKNHAFYIYNNLKMC